MSVSLKSFWRKSIQSKKLNVFGLFLLFSFIILIFSKLSKLYTETLLLDINYSNIPDNRVLTNDNNTEQLKVMVTTYGFNLLGSYFYDTSIDLDFENDTYEENNNYIWVTKQSEPNIKARLGSQFDIQRIQPDTIKFPYSTLGVKKVPVVLKHELSYASGYDSLEGIVIKPDSVDIIGSEKEIAAINRVETAKLSLKSVKSNINTSVDLILPNDSSNLKLSDKSIRVSAQVEKFTEGVMDIPVEIENLPLGVQINYFPKSIKVTYDVSLGAYKTVKPSDFRIVCDFKDDRSDQQSFLIPHLQKVPENVKRVKMKQNKIEYIITQ